MAGELATVRRVVAFRSLERRGWTFGLTPNSDQQMQDCRRAVSRNFDNEHRRYERQKVAPRANNDGEVTSKDGSICPPSG